MLLHLPGAQMFDGLLQLSWNNYAFFYFYFPGLFWQPECMNVNSFNCPSVSMKQLKL